MLPQSGTVTNVYVTLWTMAVITYMYGQEFHIISLMQPTGNQDPAQTLQLHNIGDHPG